MLTFPRSPLEIGLAQDKFLLITSPHSRSLALYVQRANQVNVGNLVQEILRLSYLHLGYGEDIFDQNSIWFAVVDEGRLAGAVRLVYLRSGTVNSLPLEKGFRLSDSGRWLSFDCSSMVEISRLLIPSAGASANLLVDLVSACLMHAYINGVNYAICASRPRQTKLFTRKFSGVVAENFTLPYVSPLTGEGYALLSMNIRKYWENKHYPAEPDKFLI
jgi:hypothetical protein